MYSLENSTVIYYSLEEAIKVAREISYLIERHVKVIDLTTGKAVF